MKTQELEIRIDPEGKVNLKVIGIQGPDCVDVTRGLEEALGALEERVHTEEYYQAAAYVVQDQTLKTR
jgi:hypothetical protein